MGLFEKRQAEATNEPLTPAEAFAGIAVCAMYSDGVLVEEEAELLGETLSRMDLYAQFDASQMRALFLKLHTLASTKGEEALLTQSAARVPENLRPTAFFVAADIALADGEVGEEEDAFLERIQQALKVDDDTADKIVDVVVIKNAG